MVTPEGGRPWRLENSGRGIWSGEGQDHKVAFLGTLLPHLPPYSHLSHLEKSDESCFSAGRKQREFRLGEGTLFPLLHLTNLVGTLRPSCYKISPTCIPRTRALPPIAVFLWPLRPPKPPRSPRGIDMSGSNLSVDPWGSSVALALCLPERKPSQQAHLSVSCLFQLPKDSVGWGLGSMSLFPLFLSPPGCCNLWFQPCFAPLAPQGQRPLPPRALHLCLAGSQLSPCLSGVTLPSPGEPEQVGWAQSVLPGTGPAPRTFLPLQLSGLPIADVLSISSGLGRVLEGTDGSRSPSQLQAGACCSSLRFAAPGWPALRRERWPFHTFFGCGSVVWSLDPISLINLVPHFPNRAPPGPKQSLFKDKASLVKVMLILRSH